MQRIIFGALPQTCLALVLLLCGIAAHALPSGITYDAASGNYIYTYQKQDGSGLATGVYIPQSKLSTSSAQSAFSLSGANTVVYRYTIANSSTSKYPVRAFFYEDIPNPLIGETLWVPSETISQGIARVRANVGVVRAPAFWKGNINRSEYGSRIRWSTPNGQGISPGSQMSGFELSSVDLPGILLAGAESGHEENPSDPDGPGEDPINDALADLTNMLDVPTINAAAPKIAVPSPFDPAVTVEHIQTEVHSWIAKKLLDASFSAQLDTLFQAAISAYRTGQPRVAQNQLEAMLTLLKLQQPDADKNNVVPTVIMPAPPATIDFLAARILYFDVGYVLGRVGL